MAETARKPAARRPAKRAPANVRNIIGDDRVTDTPTPPTPPMPEPERQTATPKASSKPRSGSLESRLGEAFASIAVVPTMVGDPYSGYIVATRSAKLSHDLAELAKVNPRVKKFLEMLLDGGAVGGVMFSGAALLLPVMWSLGAIPAPPFDPFAAFYPPVPDGILPRSVIRAHGSSTGSRAAADPSGGVATPPGGSAPVQDPPPGVVTVKKGAHPPMNAAAIQ